jgi:hypothetical protein
MEGEQNDEIKKDEIKTEKKLGRGNFADVYR